MLKKKDNAAPTVLESDKRVSAGVGENNGIDTNKKSDAEKNFVNNSLNTDPNSSHVLSPPKNLPELAKELYDKSSLQKESPDVVETPAVENKSYSRLDITPKSTIPTPSKVYIPPEPSHGSVPSFDMSLIHAKSGRDKQDMQSDDSTAMPRAQSDSLSQVNSPTAFENTNAPRQFSENFIFSKLMQSNEASSKNFNNYIGGLFNNSFFGYIEYLYSIGKIDEARLLLSNVTSSFESFHSSLGIEDLKSLERAWLFIKNREDTLRSLRYGMLEEMQYKSLSVFGISANTELMQKGFSTINSSQNMPNSPDNHVPVQKSDSGLFSKDFLDLLKKGAFSGESTSSPFNSALNVQITDSSKFFYVADGSILRSFKDLVFSLKNMSDDIFNIHVNQYKNDFSNWVRDVLMQPILADKMKQYNNRYSLVDYLGSI